MKRTIDAGEELFCIPVSTGEGVEGSIWKVKSEDIKIDQVARWAIVITLSATAGFHSRLSHGCFPVSSP